MTVEKAGELLDKAVNALIIDMKRLTGGEKFYIVAMVAVRNSDGTWTGYQSCYSDEKLGKVIDDYLGGVLHMINMINIYEQGRDRIEALQKEVERLMLKEAELQCSSIWEIKGTGDDPDELQRKILEINQRFKDTLFKRQEQEEGDGDA